MWGNWFAFPLRPSDFSMVDQFKTQIFIWKVYHMADTKYWYELGIYINPSHSVLSKLWPPTESSPFLSILSLRPPTCHAITPRLYRPSPSNSYYSKRLIIKDLLRPAAFCRPLEMICPSQPFNVYIVHKIVDISQRYFISSRLKND